MAPLFSKVDLNKLWHDVQNEETLICAKFGKDMFNISKVIGRKKWPSFFLLTVYYAQVISSLVYQLSVQIYSSRTDFVVKTQSEARLFGHGSNPIQSNHQRRKHFQL